MQEFFKKTCDEMGLNKREAKEIVELFFEEIKSSLEVGEQVKISGFGKFELKDKSSRPGRNPKTGEEAIISARKVVRFKSGKHFKHTVNDVNS